MKIVISASAEVLCDRATGPGLNDYRRETATAAAPVAELHRCELNDNDLSSMNDQLPLSDSLSSTSRGKVLNG